DRHETADAALAGHAADEEPPHAEEEGDRKDPGENVAQQRAFDDAAELDALLIELGGEIGFDARGDETGFAVLRRLEIAGDVLVGDRDALDLPVVQITLEGAVG